MNCEEEERDRASEGGSGERRWARTNIGGGGQERDDGEEGGEGKRAGKEGLALNAGCERGGGGREAADGRARWAWWKYFSVLAAKM